MDARFQFLVYLGLLMGFHRLGSVAFGPFSGINYARNKNATQEPSTLNNYTADLAVDGNTDSLVEKKLSCSHTWGDPSLPSYWTVDLGLTLYITGIIVYNRKEPEDLRSRLKNFKIYGIIKFEKDIIYDDDKNNLYLQEVIIIEINATQTYSSIQIWIPPRINDTTILTLCEVEVYGGPEINYARHKNAIQEPNTLNNYTADLAVDGKIYNYINNYSCTHTWGNPSLPSSWTVDLGFPLYINEIIIYNRKESIFWIRLVNFKIYGLSGSDKETIYDDDENNLYLQEVIIIEINATQTYSSIQIWIPARINDTTILTLCEVEVYGVPGCEPPTLASHVQISSSPTEYTIGSAIELTCSIGYTPPENETITCSNNSTWSGLQPSCSRITCQSPEVFENGYYLVSNETVCEWNDLNNLHYLCNITAYCNEGYSLQNKSERTCQENGQWTSSYPLCAIITCNFPGEFSNGKYIYNGDDYVSGPLNYATKIEVKCIEGYKVNGFMARLCTSNGNWSDVDPHCSIVKCNIQDLGKIANGYYVLNDNKELNTSFATYLQTASVVCTTGFKLVSDSTATCSSDGVWSRQPASCNVVTCLAPTETADVKYKIWHNTSYGSFVNAFPFGSFSEVICVNGILKAGSRIRHCKPDGLWDGDDAVCVPLCNAPEVTNGILRDENNTRLDIYEEGETLSLTCFEGFTSVKGQRNLTCLKNHSWNALPICSKITEETSSTHTDPQKAVIGGLSGGLAIAVLAAVAAVGAFLVYFLKWQRRKSQDAELYTRLRTQLASNIESEYAKIQETVVT